ncbi:Serine/threonine-protein phosphatase 2A regulatory subunit B'' subunit beta [Paragonimus heterotremus]|uniref:Serine/threonine-protein phosphatase 2A regulatory subunit B'' subunit beta n=1 Tax=Paragonimus heterotremus TaxID=100268 RepID=A0A8J4WKV4_9TREM|nr:Serine/threonine-protein phosphatase 2A regulatory subunit B'' subunit beta [Paragonimus heterotremus]
MPVLTGTPSLVIASRVQVYHTCSVDLTWQRTIHSCQRCPRAVLITSAVSVPPITQSNVERTHSRFCPAGVHMSNCVPASEIFVVQSKHTATRMQSGVKNSPNYTTGLELIPSVWGPPNLPAPAASPHHPVHAAHMARNSYPPASTVVITPAEAVSTKSISSAVHHFVPTLKKTDIPKVSDSDDNLLAATFTPSTGEHDESLPQTGPPKLERIVTPSITIVREPQKTPEPSPVCVTPVEDVTKEVNGASSSVESVVSTPVDADGLDQPERKPLNTTLECDEGSSAETRLSEGTTAKKPKKDEVNVSVLKSKSNTVVSDSVQKPADDNFTSGRTSNRTTSQDNETEKNRNSKTNLRPTDRPGPKQQHAAPSSVQINEPPKVDAGQPQNRSPSGTQTTVSSRDSRDVTRPVNQSQASTVSTGTGGGVGDVGFGLIKPNGVRIDQPRSNQTDLHAPPSLSKPAVSDPLISARKTVPSFHFPFGTTRMSSEEITFEVDRAKRELNRIVERNGTSDGKKSDPLIAHTNFGQVARALNCPLYWKYAVYTASGGTDEHQPLAMSAVLKMWHQVLTSCPDEVARFVYMLTKGKSTTLVQADLNPLIQDILGSHPGLAFLQAAKDFHSRYVSTVVARIFFNVNSSWSGRISLGELRRSNFLSVLASLEDEEDINMVTQYFSYEHFYVIYCKFWELDEDHDLIISRADLMRHNNYAISERMIERIFSGTVTRGTAFKEGVMTYPDFVWFLLAEEDKRHPRSIEYWFRCMDLDGDGLLSMYELEYFYSEQVARMEEMGIEPISFEDCLCQCLDMVKPALGDKIRLSDMKQCRLCHIFFDTFFNLPKYLQHEQRDPFSNLRDIEEGLNELSDWDRYAAEAYEMLVAVDVGNQEDGVEEEDGEDEDLDEEPEHASLTPVIGPKSDINPQKAASVASGVSNKLEAKLEDHMSPGSPAGAGESAESTTSPETGRKGKRRRGTVVNGNG